MSDITSTDLSLNYSFQWGVLGKDVEIFLQPEILNLFDNDGLLNVNTTVFDATSGCPGASNANCRVNPGRPFNNNPNDPNYNPSVTLQPFNPFPDTPTEGVHWRKSDNFGKGTSENDFQLPRTYRFSVGIRF